MPWLCSPADAAVPDTVTAVSAPTTSSTYLIDLEVEESATERVIVGCDLTTTLPTALPVSVTDTFVMT